jgi:hypothetical protein
MLIRDYVSTQERLTQFTIKNKQPWWLFIKFWQCNKRQANQNLLIASNHAAVENKKASTEP